MKRIANLYSQIYCMKNLQLADAIASTGKSKQPGVIEHRKAEDQNLRSLQEMLMNKTYKTSQYDTFKVYEPKERLVYRLPYFPDRITHHAILNLLEPIFVSTFTADTYSCIKGRGIHAAAKNLRKALKDVDGTKYCLKQDITKFYPSVHHQILKQQLRRKFKDKDLLWLLDEIIDSAPGLPIGNYLSQYLANYYLTAFDHWIKEQRGIKYYFRYADDLVILSDSKEYLHQVRKDIQEYFSFELNLAVKPNHQVFPVALRGIDFVGYRFFHTHTLLRKRIKKGFAKMLKRKKNIASIGAYYGWAKHCNSNHLLKKLLSNEELQRLRNRTGTGRIRRRQNKNRPVDQPGDHSVRIPD